MLQTTTKPTTLRDSAPCLLEPAACASCDAGTCEVVFGNDPDGFVLCRECLSRLDTILSRGRQLAS
jgi:hypothetical protein